MGFNSAFKGLKQVLENPTLYHNTPLPLGCEYHVAVHR